MKRMGYRLGIVGLSFICMGCAQEKSPPAIKSILVLGDMHYDRMEDHDITWLKTKPDDLRQVTKEYTVFTKLNFERLIQEVLSQSREYQPPIQAVVQVGDLQEGLAGTPDLARNMASHSLSALRASDMQVPWVLIKGNHDITGPGAIETYKDIVIPFIQNEIGHPITGSFYAYQAGNIKIIALDCYDRENLLPFLESELKESNARYNIVATHQPVIPMTGRCWHVFNQPKDAEKREKLLSLLAKYKALVLSAHLHRYSVVRRETPDGPIVQLSTCSVIRESNRHEPYWYNKKYGPSLIDLEPDFSPDTKAKRAQILEEEAKYVTDFRVADLPGYTILELDDTKGSMVAKAYCGLGKTFFEEVDLSALTGSRQ